jgi:hypothetical protein
MKPKDRRGRPKQYPRALKMAISLLGQPGMNDRKIFRLCKEKHGEKEQLPASYDSFMRRVRAHAAKK